MVIGFGSTEENVEKEVTELIRSEIKKTVDLLTPDYFDTETIKRVTKSVEFLAKRSREISDSYETDPNYPERYSSFYAYIVADCNYVVAILKFHHINRRHAFSPDGWALLSTKKTVSFSHQDF